MNHPRSEGHKCLDESMCILDGDCPCFPRDKNGKPIPNTWYKREDTHISTRGWKKQFARCMLISSLDYLYKDYDEVICNGCNKDIKPDNCYMVEYSDDEEDWEIYDVYCFGCVKKYFSRAEKIDDELI